MVLFVKDSFVYHFFETLWFSLCIYAENGPLYNLTFWRPRAPSNYVILGDCVTSRYVERIFENICYA